MTRTLLESYSIALESTSDLNHRILKENRELQAENNDLKIELELLQGGDEQGVKCSNQLQVDRLNADNDKLLEYNNRLLAEIKRLKEDNSKHYPKEYKQEAEEYFNNNPQAEKLFFFMVGGSGVDEDGDVINTLNVGADAIAECDNFKGIISVETYD